MLDSTCSFSDKEYFGFFHQLVSSLLFRPSCNSDLAGRHLFSRGERYGIFSLNVFT